MFKRFLKERKKDISYFLGDEQELTDLKKMIKECESYEVLVNEKGEIERLVYKED